MTWFGAGSAFSRHTMVAVLFAGVALTAVSVQAQNAPAPAAAPAAPAAPADDPFKFTSDAALIIWYVKPEQTAAFENVWGSIRGALAVSAKPELKALGDSLHIFKAPGEPTPQGVTYFFVANPASKAVSYSPSPFLLFEAGLFDDATARKLFEQLSASINNINPLPLNAAAAPIAPVAAAPAAAPAP